MKKPLILVDFCYDDPTRGDCKGYLGLAERIAGKTGGRYFYADRKILNAQFPNTRRYENQLKSFLADKGLPDIVLRSPESKIHTPRAADGLVVDTINELLAHTYDVMPTYLVPHNITPERLAREGALFDWHYPKFPRPLIAIMMVELNGRAQQRAFAKKITSVATQYGDATLFLCTCRRTPLAHYNELKEELRKTIAGKKMSGHIHTRHFNLKTDLEKKGYNPYLGLLARADHIIMTGESVSILSKSLACGKSVYTYSARDGESEYYGEKDLIHSFNAAAADKPLETKEITTPDITALIADKIIAQWRANKNPAMPAPEAP